MKKKPLILILTVSLGILLLVLISFYFFLKDDTTDSPGEDRGFFSFLPFGSGGADQPREEVPVDPTEGEPQQIENYDQKLRLLSREPVSGMIALESDAGTSVRYIEKATGHIYEVELFSPNRTRISNTTIPVVYDSLWSNTGRSMLASYLAGDDRTVEVYGLILETNSTSTESVVSAIKFPPNIKNFSVLGNSLFYLQETETGSVGYTSNFDSTGRKQVLSYPIKEFISQYVGTRTVALTTKPDNASWGYLYLLDTNNGSMRLVLRKIYGLSSLVSSDASQVIFSENNNQSAMYLYSITNNTTEGLSPSTFPEKCVFSRKNVSVFFCSVPSNYLDGSSLVSWYKGLISMEDSIWKYDTEKDSSTVISDLYSESGAPIDVIKPILSPEERYLLFINKIDGSLWSLDLTK